ncbi:MAG: AMP-binding protein, partial [Candidatus Riflebacteria bacterium]|nr:AMP-binding protein [Candidatus Riflebacteria bacterium]
LEALAALVRTRLFPASFRRSLPRQWPEDPAVVLFTSGSEKAPKAVPLTHRNILSNSEAILEAFHVTASDSVLGFLPPFHSFGLTVTMVTPVLAGVRVVHHPDPTDAAALARKATSYRTTILCATPTFISYILDRAAPGDLDSLRLLVAGAEKCPDHVFEKGRRLAPNASVLEGYGITECAPVVSANLEGRSRRGSIGVPLKHVEVRVVDVDDLGPVPVGRTGLLLIRGPNVFPGYLGDGGSDPFLQRDGVSWYNSGDLARIDEEGFIWFAGRLKRFLKAGGEMISLPALEAPLAELYPPDEQGPRVAVEGIETPGGRRIVLFATVPITSREANQVLQESGFSGIMRLDEVRIVERIPVLGTGKTDYKILRAWIQEPPEPASGPDHGVHRPASGSNGRDGR